MPQFSVKEIKFLEINNLINCVRNFLLNRAFVEINLYSTTIYKFSKTDYMTTSVGDRLRNNTEPDVWQFHDQLDAFFSISSLFRIEDTTSILHKQEFKIADFYQISEPQKLTEILFDLLRDIEIRLNLPALSSLPKTFSSYEDFEPNTVTDIDPCILQVSNYPTTESFFDAGQEYSNHTQKSELYLLGFGQPIEFAVFGKVGPNLNPNRKFIPEGEIAIKMPANKLSGLGLGIERIIYCYKNLETNKRNDHEKI